MSEYRERKPTSKGLLARVKCQQRNARTNAILSVFPKPRESVSLQKSCYVAGSITSQYFPFFLNLSESCWEKAVFVQPHITSLHSKFRQTALKLTPKGLDYTQIDTLGHPHKMFRFPSPDRPIFWKSKNKKKQKKKFRITCKEASATPITLCGKPISPIPVAKDLGVFLDQCLSYNEHIRKTVASCMNKLIQINRIKHLFDKETLLLVINSFVFSRLFYCSSVWSNTSATNIHKLQLVQNFAARTILGLRKYDHISAGLRSLQWLNVKQRLMVRPF